MNALNRDRQKSKHIESERFPKTFSSAKLCYPLQNPVDFLGTRFYHLLNDLNSNATSFPEEHYKPTKV